MGLFDIFKRNKNNFNVSEKELKEPVPQQDTNNQQQESIQDFNDFTIDETNEFFKDEPSKYSDIISNEIIEKIVKKNNLMYISDSLVRKMEKYPDLVELLLNGNMSEDILFLLGQEEISYLPSNKEDLKYIKYLNFNEEMQKLVSLLDNQTDIDITNGEYIGCRFDLSKDFETINYNNTINSFIPNIKIDLGNELLTKIDTYSSIKVYLPKSKYKSEEHNFTDYIVGNIELDENTIILMDYSHFKYLDQSIIDKISKCKIILNDNELSNDMSWDSDDDMNNNETIDYSLLKCNHLLYVIENSSLNQQIKDKMIYKLKSVYTNNKDSNFYLEFELSTILKTLSQIDIDELKSLTEQFGVNIDLYKNKSIEKPEFNVGYYIDDYIQDFDKKTVDDVMYFVRTSPAELKASILRDPRIAQKLNLTTNLDDQELERVIISLDQKLDSTTTGFVNSLDFDIQRFMENPDNNYLTSYDINPVISKYGVFDYVKEDVNISVADILGHDGATNDGAYLGKNILYTFKNFFKNNGDGYHTRALGLLDYKSGEELLKELEQRNNDTRDMKVCELENGKYIIQGNGLHRFSILRFHYLLDRMKNEKSEEELRDLYRIPVKLDSKTNYVKTYSNYLLQKSDPDINYVTFSPFEDKITISYKSNKESVTINEEKLHFLVTQSIDMLDQDALSEIMNFYNNNASFHEFVDKYIPNLLNKNEMVNMEMMQR